MKKTILTVLIIMLAGKTLFAGAGTTGAEFLKVNVGGRASAFCGAYTAVSGDVFAGQYNPAGLSRLEKKELALMHNEWLLGTRYEFFAFGLPVKNGGVAVSVRYFDMGEFTGRDGIGVKTGSFKANDQSLNLSYGRLLNDVVSMGVSFVYIKQTIASKTSMGFAADLGLNFSVMRDYMTLAFVSKNLGPGMSAFDKEKMDLPQSNNIGILFMPMDGNLLFTGDIVIPKDGNSYLAMGCEYGIIDIIDIRSGMSFGSEREDAFSWCAGMGINIMDYSLDYCFEPVGDLDSSHRISLSIKF